MLLLLAACTSSDLDTAETGDTGKPAEPVVLDEVLPSAAASAWACRWVYVAANLDSYTMVADLAFPEGDELTRTDLSYNRPLSEGESLQFGGGSGGGDLAVFDCSDVMDNLQGVQVWTATAATISIEATYVEDRPEWTCDGVSDNPVYDMDVTITDATFVDEAGAEATLASWGPLSVQVADYCGG
jgi:hypothetical protein